jgi:hypothetical protein
VDLPVGGVAMLRVDPAGVPVVQLVSWAGPASG